MNIIVDWDPDFERLYRERGFEILEPLEDDYPLSRLELLSELTWSEVVRACRWPGAIAMLMGFLAGSILDGAGLENPGRLIAVFAITFAIMNLLMPRAYRREYRRRRNSLRA